MFPAPRPCRATPSPADQLGAEDELPVHAPVRAGEALLLGQEWLDSAWRAVAERMTRPTYEYKLGFYKVTLVFVQGATAGAVDREPERNELTAFAAARAPGTRLAIVRGRRRQVSGWRCPVLSSAAEQGVRDLDMSVGVCG